MSSYRISSLPALPPSLDRTRFRKALSAMSVHNVSRHWLRREAGLANAEIDSLLALLDGAGVLLGPFPEESADAPANPLADGPPRRRRDSTWRLLLQLLRSRLARAAVQVRRPAPESPRAQEVPRAAAPGWLDDIAPSTLERIGDDLRALLAQHPRARRVLTHLGVLERALRRKDVAAANALPISVLRRALDQLRAIGIPDDSPGLAILRSRLMLVVLRSDDDVAPLTRSVEVDEVGLSRFVEAQQQWELHAPSLPVPR
ncbi:MULTISPECIES: hypothetical protein [unclassified Rhizobacter]|uniref:hypothetical protein n=1 Tax=unclassified Rhizobacter TaxID=2640088 RepID=UPI0006FD6D66|nr:MULTISPECIES: hypothetical protein [unclassified Rhizobacter]KQU67897.1 hypothetical protein ASC88_08020 [Rhizobacter sp. Root29]KQW15216.1 hypothetical protein ASC98_13895 [Rhizobacter sp. Root1238]KRB24380.1 hypothetical protein ASE08_17880 [Rhizobacter sp. Root16D2]